MDVILHAVHNYWFLTFSFDNAGNIFMELRFPAAMNQIFSAFNGKNNSTNFINDHKFVRGKFAWQEGYGAFSYSHSHLKKVYDYILHQEEHHRKKTFKEEYIGLLQNFQIEYDEKYLFEWYD